MSNTTPQHSSNSAATDVPQLIGELDAGQFERMVSIALSQCAASTVDNGKKSKVKIELDIEPIKGTHQVQSILKIVHGPVQHVPIGHAVVYAGTNDP